MTQLILGDSREVLKTLETNSIDACVTDPPYELTSIVKRFGPGQTEAQHGTNGAFVRASKGFMNQTWDGTGIQRDPAFWAEVLRVMKPGGQMLAFGGTRTYHRMACAIEDAGFDLRDSIGYAWMYATGFPKSHNLDGDWEGWGTALKPAWEPICLARKPLSEKTVAANVLKWGTGALNIDGSRIETEDEWEASGVQSPASTALSGGIDASLNVSVSSTHPAGRWPANIILDEQAAAELDRQSGISSASKPRQDRGTGGIWDAGNGVPCGPQHGDTGGASRFFYVAKPDQAERGAGLGGFKQKVKLRPDLSPEQRAYVMQELKAAGVRL